jgi:hypothetical protein
VAYRPPENVREERAALAQDAVARVSQVHFRHEDRFDGPVRQAHLLAFYPNDVAGEVGHLVGGRRNARTQAVRLGAADGVAEQVLVDGVVAGAVGRRAAGQFVKLLAHHALLVKAVTQAFLGGVGARPSCLNR